MLANIYKPIYINVVSDIDNSINDLDLSMFCSHQTSSIFAASERVM